MRPHRLLEIEESPLSSEAFLIGEIDFSNAEGAGAALGVMMRGGPDWALDLSGLTFLDCAGARMLIEVAGALSGELRLKGLSPHLRRVLALLDVEARAPNIVVLPPDRPRAGSERRAGPRVTGRLPGRSRRGLGLP